MTDRLQKQKIAQRLAARMATDEKTAVAWLDAVTETLCEAISAGESVTPPGFGGFYVREERNGRAFKFNPSQRLRALLGWASTYKGE